MLGGDVVRGGAMLCWAVVRDGWMDGFLVRCGVGSLSCRE